MHHTLHHILHHTVVHFLCTTLLHVKNFIEKHSIYNLAILNKCTTLLTNVPHVSDYMFYVPPPFHYFIHFTLLYITWA